MNHDRVRDGWVDRAGEFSPTYYAHRGPDETSAAVGDALVGRVDRDAPVLEVGCSAGRHLAHLHERGFTDLAGMEVNERAFEVLAEQYPALDGSLTRLRGALEELAPGLATDRFAATYSVETLQHLHPEGVRTALAELVRATGEVLVTAEIESPSETTTVDRTVEPGRGLAGRTPVTHVRDELPLYYRDWGAVFARLGLEEVAAERVGRDVVRTFRVPAEAPQGR